MVNEEFRKDLGRRARDFVETRWLASRSAERILALARGDFPKEWLFNPTCCDYILGMGMPKESVLLIMRSMLLEFGIKSFGFEDKPNIEKQIQDFVEGKSATQ